MIKKYTNFTLINEDWKGDFIKNLKENPVINETDIEDYFTELTDEGFTLIAHHDVEYKKDNISQSVVRKSDLSNNRCYLTYKLNLRKVIIINSIQSFQMYIQKSNLYVDMFNSAFNRMVKSIDAVFKLEESALHIGLNENGIILFSVKIFLKDYINNINLKSIGIKTPYYRLFYSFLNNKSFTIDDDKSYDNNLYLKANDDIFGKISVEKMEKIVQSIFKSYPNNIPVFKVTEVDKHEYLISILEK